MKNLSKRDRRVVITGGIVVAALLLFTYGVLPFYDAQKAVGRRLNNSEERLKRYVSEIQLEPAYSKQLKELEAVLSHTDSKLLQARDPSIASAQLLEIVKGLENQTGVSIVRSNPLPEKKVGEHFSRITLQIHLESNMTALTNFLYALSTYPKFLIVDDFTVQSFQSRGDTRIQPRMQISAFIRLS